MELGECNENRGVATADALGVSPDDPVWVPHNLLMFPKTAERRPLSFSDLTKTLTSETQNTRLGNEARMTCFQVRCNSRDVGIGNY
jgi:hypothetical protein